MCKRGNKKLCFFFKLFEMTNSYGVWHFDINELFLIKDVNCLLIIEYQEGLLKELINLKLWLVLQLVYRIRVYYYK